MPNTEQINDLIARELSFILSKESLLPNGMITITGVDSSPDLKNAKIYVSVLPEKYCGSALKILRQNSSKFSKQLLKNTRLRQIPRFKWVFDTTGKNAGQIDEILKKIKEENL
jgi:ribosome-binding factor A